MPDDLSAVIDWANGSVTTVTGTDSIYGQIVYVDPNNPAAGFDVIGSQTYAEAGAYAVRTTIEDYGTPIGTLDCDVTVADASLSVAISPSFASGFCENQFDGGEVATFTDSGGPGATTSYAATINWGDGATTAGQIAYAAAAGQFTVSDNTDHTYTTEPTSPVTVTVYDEDGASATAEQSITVEDLGYGGPPTPSDAEITTVNGTFNNGA